MVDLNKFQFPGAVFIRCESDIPITVTPFIVKGALMKYFPNEKFISFINGDLRGVYSYPRIQVKILRNQLCLFAVNEGIGPTVSLAEQLSHMNIDNQDVHFNHKEILEYPDQFSLTPEKFHKYKFITPWVALNDQQVYKYEPLFTSERRDYLNSVLAKNLEFMIKDLGNDPSDSVQVRFRAGSLTPKIVNYSKMGSFKGYFTSNVRLPNYIGLGNNITKGLGTLIKWEYKPGTSNTDKKPTESEPAESE
jgi:hypothetical protein